MLNYKLIFEGLPNLWLVYDLPKNKESRII